MHRIGAVSYTHLDVYKRQDESPGGSRILVSSKTYRRFVRSKMTHPHVTCSAAENLLFPRQSINDEKPRRRACV